MPPISVGFPTMKIFAEMINRFLPGDYESIADGEKEFKTYGDVSESILRLASLGLMQKISRIISDATGLEQSQFQSGIVILPYENGGVFKYTSLGLKLRAILFPEMDENTGIIELDYSKTINMV